MNSVRVGLYVSAAAIALALAASCGSTPPSRLEFVSVEPNPPRIGETTTVKFKASDDRGLPLEGATIRFALETPEAPGTSGSDAGTTGADADAGTQAFPGVTLSPTVAQTQKESGEVNVTLVATTRVSSVVVVATSDDGSVIARSPPISFAGTGASGRQLTFQCGELAGDASGGVHAIGAYDQSRNLIAGVKVNCYAHVADRNGDGIPNTLVSFLTEAGAINPTATTSAEVVGNAKVLYKTSYPLPLDVPAEGFSWVVNNDATHTGNFKVPLWMEPWTWKADPIANFAVAPVPCQAADGADCPEPQRADPTRPPPPSLESRILNPRDNLVTIIAVTRGEEGFTDANNNGQWDSGESFDDLTEPFVDMNDNGTRDVNEAFIDTNNNGSWDGKNGIFDTSTLIWTEEKILWTGLPHSPSDYTGSRPTVKLVRPVTAPTIAHHGSAGGAVIYSDPWYNSIAQNDNADHCALTGSELVIGSPSEFALGRPLTYPSPRQVTFTVSDAHDITEPAGYPSPVPFAVGVDCTFTNSPIDGFAVTINLATLSGTVQ